jgi:hypothetical protein
MYGLRNVGIGLVELVRGGAAFNNYYQYCSSSTSNFQSRVGRVLSALVHACCVTTEQRMHINLRSQNKRFVEARGIASARFR